MVSHKSMKLWEEEQNDSSTTHLFLEPLSRHLNRSLKPTRVSVTTRFCLLFPIRSVRDPEWDDVVRLSLNEGCIRGWGIYKGGRTRKRQGIRKRPRPTRKWKHIQRQGPHFPPWCACLTSPLLQSPPSPDIVPDPDATDCGRRCKSTYTLLPVGAGTVLAV